MLRDFSGLLFEYIFYVGQRAVFVSEKANITAIVENIPFSRISIICIIQGPNNLIEIKEISPQFPHLCCVWTMTGQIKGKFMFVAVGQFKRKVAIATELQLLLLLLLLPKIPTLSNNFVRAHFIFINWHMLCDGVASEIIFLPPLLIHFCTIFFISYLFLI